jgi:uncharacterized alkaline shock family protein YloU
LEVEIMEESKETRENLEEKVEVEEPTITEDKNADVSDESIKGSVHISEEVVTELAKRALATVDGVHAASPGLASKLGLGRKAAEGVRISLHESAEVPSITVDIYVMAKYGKRIPDLAWDVQECVREQLEEYTGYSVKSVNVNIQGVYFSEENVRDVTEKEEPAKEEPAKEAEVVSEEENKEEMPGQD